MSEVVSLRGTPAAVECNAATIERLEELLQLARDGQLIGIIYAGVMARDATLSGWTHLPDGRDFGVAMVRLQWEYGRSQSCD